MSFNDHEKQIERLYEIIEMLINHNPTIVGHTDMYGNTALIYACSFSRLSVIPQSGCLVWPSTSDDVNIVRLLLSTTKSKPGHQNNDGYTALMKCLTAGNNLTIGNMYFCWNYSKEWSYSIAQLLIKSGQSNITAIDNHGKTALIHYMMRFSRSNNICLLLIGSSIRTLRMKDETNTYPFQMEYRRGDDMYIINYLCMGGISRGVIEHLDDDVYNDEFRFAVLLRLNRECVITQIKYIRVMKDIHNGYENWKTRSIAAKKIRKFMKEYLLGDILFYKTLANDSALLGSVYKEITTN
jgi:hypothetical protein